MAGEGESGNGTQEQPEDKGVDLAKVVESLSAKYGGLDAALREIVRENFKFRDDNRRLKELVPKEGSLVLDGDSLKHWNTYRELGSPSDLKKQLEEGRQAHADKASLLKEKVIGQAAVLHGFNASVLGTLAKDVGVEVREKVDGAGRPVLQEGRAQLIAVVKGDGDKATPLEDYAKAHWADFMPSLKPDSAQKLGTPPRNNPGGPPPKPPGERRLFKTTPL